MKPKIIFNILTMYPDMLKGYLNDSYIKRAIENNEIKFNIINHRDIEKSFSHLYDYPYGGGPGQIMRVDSFFKAMSPYLNKQSRTVIFDPKGEKLNQKKLFNLSKKKTINLICPRFEGFDKRIEEYCDDVISLGDYVLNGGELACLCVIEGVFRLISQDIKKESVENDSFGHDGMSERTEYNQYTRPEEFKGMEVPKVLLSGNHKKINEYRRAQQKEVNKNK